MIEELGPSPETLYRVCRMDNDPLFEDARNHAFLSRAIFHSRNPYCAEPTIPAHSHSRIMEPAVDYPRL
eukprot:11831567-Prorocentrum_lima.AAC.1